MISKCYCPSTRTFGRLASFRSWPSAQRIARINRRTRSGGHFPNVFSWLFDPVSKLMEGAVLCYIGNVLVNLLVDLVYRLVNPWMR